MVTDISRDGTLSGANLKLIDDLLKITSLNIILSGGVSSDEDISKLRATELQGIVVGTALYKDLLSI